MAEAGLAAFVTGAAHAVAAKTGLLLKLRWFLVVGVAAIVAGVKKMVGKGSGEGRPRTRRTTAPARDACARRRLRVARTRSR